MPTRLKDFDMVSAVLIRLGTAYFFLFDQCALFFKAVHQFSDLAVKSFVRIPLLVKNVHLTTHQMYVIGVESLPLVIITSIFVGGETVIQANFQFSGVIPMRYLGYVVSKSLITELCPVLTSFVVASRVATAIAAEIGFMKTCEQFDAMTCLSLDSIRYFIMPKVVAAVIMIPILVIFSEIVAFAGSAITAFFFIKISMHVYCLGLKLFFSLFDMAVGILKTTIFGAVIAFCGAHFGLQAVKGARGIGDATTRAVMASMVIILFFDFLIAFLLL